MSYYKCEAKARGEQVQNVYIDVGLQADLQFQFMVCIMACQKGGIVVLSPASYTGYL